MRFLPIALLLAVTLNGCLDALTGTHSVEPEDYIGDNEYTKWVIEIDYVAGHKPSNAAMSLLTDRLEDLVQKDSVTVQVGNTLPGRGTWSDSAIDNLEADHKDRETGGDTVVTWVAYVDGVSSHGDGVLGVTYGYDRVIIFSEAIDNACGILSGCAFAEGDIEQAVLVHEFGHALGLVNRGLEMVNDHEDDDHPRHSNNRNSVMYWAVESAGSLGNLNTIPKSFDSNDKRDVCAAGGQGSC